MSRARHERAVYSRAAIAVGLTREDTFHSWRPREQCRERLYSQEIMATCVSHEGRWKCERPCDSLGPYSPRLPAESFD